MKSNILSIGTRMPTANGHHLWSGIALAGVLSVALGVLSHPEPASAAGFPANSCRPGFIQAGPRLCIGQNVHAAATFDTAMRFCRNERAYVASYGDIFYLLVNTNLDANYLVPGRWLGPDLVEDDRAFIINSTNVPNFEGGVSKFDSRPYVCAHDDQQND